MLEELAPFVSCTGVLALLSLSRCCSDCDKREALKQLQLNSVKSGSTEVISTVSPPPFLIQKRQTLSG